MNRPIEPLLFLLPALLVTAAVVLFPALQTVWLGLHHYILFDPDNRSFVGLNNFAAILRDELFWISLSNSIIWVVSAVGFQFLLGLVTALLLNQTFAGRSFARALVVIPWALPSVIIGLMWTWMYDLNLGVINDLLLRSGLIQTPVAWLSQPSKPALHHLARLARCHRYGSFIAHHLGRELAGCHLGDDRRRPGVQHPHAALVCVS